MMMGKLVAAKRKGRPRKKRKGRPPSAANLSGRRPPPPPSSTSQRRRLVRSRDDDFDDGEHDEEGEDEELESSEREEMEGKRRAKKLKLVLRLPHHVPTRTGGAGVAHVSAAASSSSSTSHSFLEDEDSTKRLKRRRRKRRRIDGCDGGVYDEGCIARSDGSGSGREQLLQDGKKNGVPRCEGSLSGRTPPRPLTATPLPDRKTLESILDTLQKKDRYSVYAEPVDPEELPDYHEVIEHPMDFGTIRKKLVGDAYATLEEFESDIFLICTNAMQYNGPGTIYFRQARSIQELGRKKFQTLRVDNEQKFQTLRVNNEQKFQTLRIAGDCIDIGGTSEQKTRSNSVAKKPIRKSSCRNAEEPAGSDISSAATLASTGDTCNGLNGTQDVFAERPVNVSGLVHDSSLLSDIKPEKIEELSAKNLPAKLWRKPCVMDENRRATYNILNQQPVIQSDTVFATFESEKKLLDAVGLHAEYAYARSLAHFAATLGPVSWRIASEKIKKALPAGIKFGPGWVGEYEPLPTPVLSLESHSQQQSGYSKNLHCSTELRKDKESGEELKATQNGVSKKVQVGSKTLLNSSATRISNRALNPVKERSFSGPTREQKLGLYGVTAGTSPVITNAVAPETSKVYPNAKAYTNVLQKVQVSNSSSLSTTPVDIASRRPECSSEVTTSRLMELVSGNRNHVHSESLKQSETETYQCGINRSGLEAGGMSSGKNVRNSDGSRPTTSLDYISNLQAGGASYCFTRSNHEQTVDDPVKVIRMLSGKMPNSLSSQMVETLKQFISPMLSPSNNPSTAATRAWMSIGTASERQSTEASCVPKMQVEAASLYNPTWESPSLASRFHDVVNIRPTSQVLQQPRQAVGEESLFNNKDLEGFPRSIAADLSRFQGQSSPWRDLVPHALQKQKMDMLPPDLNIGFQSPGSPVQQSSGILVDSQQPDLALQL